MPEMLKVYFNDLDFEVNCSIVGRSSKKNCFLSVLIGCINALHTYTHSHIVAVYSIVCLLACFWTLS